LRRAGWTDLCGTWGFAFDDGDVGQAEGWERLEAPFTREIVVP
jgi:hypothetical protein